LISAANITMQFGAKPLFENISVKFGDGNRYGLIGANGCGKSTFMNILSGELEPSSGNVSVTPNERIGKLNQDQFAFEQYSVVDTVIMGHTELWKVKQERERLYALPEMSEDEGMQVAELEVQFAEMDGYTAESRAAEFLSGAGIEEALHFGPMTEVAPGWKLRVLLAQALFSEPDILLLDEPTNNLDINAEKIQLADIKPSSRVSPYIRFTQEKKLHRLAITIENLSHGFDEGPLFTNGSFMLEAGSRLAIIGENGVGKTTLLRCLLNELEPNGGRVQWAENATQGYCPQDNTEDFNTDLTLFDWMSQWRKPTHDDQIVRSTLGRLLFSSEDFKKKVKVCSGGEKNRLLFGKLTMLEPNVLVLDEPTNHLDMESIESLNLALTYYEGTIIFVSHDREFVSSLATHIVEIKDERMQLFAGTYDEFLSTQKALAKKTG